MLEILFKQVSLFSGPHLHKIEVLEMSQTKEIVHILSNTFQNMIPIFAKIICGKIVPGFFLICIGVLVSPKVNNVMLVLGLGDGFKDQETMEFGVWGF